MMASPSQYRAAVTAAVFLLASGPPALGATRFWTGGTPGDPTCSQNPAWGDPCNWSGKLLPAPGDDLIFNGGPPSINTFSAGTTFNSITISGHAIVGGAPIALNAGINASGAQISLSGITLNGNQNFTVPNAGTGAVITSSINNNGNLLRLDATGTLSLVGVISGPGFLTTRGPGIAVLSGQNSYTGGTGADSGLLLINGSQPASAIDMEGGMLGGTGTVGPVGVRISPAAVLPGGANNGTGILTVSGDLTFSTGGVKSLKVDLKGTTAGSGYDQVNVTGGLVKLGTGNNLEVTLGFTPTAGDLFVIINNDGADLVQGTFAAKAEGSFFTVGTTTFAISYQGGDGNDVVLHVPTTRTWDGGGGDNKWSTAANWVGDVVPAVGDDLVFPIGAAQLANTNDLPAGTVFNSITIQAGSYFLQGNAIGLRNGITSTATSGGTIGVGFASIRLELDQSFTNNGNRGFFIQTPINTNGHRVTLAGSALPQVLQAFSRTISGTGGFTMAAAGFCFLDGTSPKVNTYTGTTVINSGTLSVRTTQPSSPVQLTGGVLSGQGQVGPITATGGRIRPFDGVPQTLEVAGDVTLSSTVEFDSALSTNGNFSQLIVTGAVRLNSAALTLTDNHGNASIGESFMIISNDGSDAIEGTFASLPEGSSVVVTSNNRTYSISYAGGDGNDVVLTLTALPPPTPTPTPNCHGNAIPAAAGEHRDAPASRGGQQCAHRRIHYHRLPGQKGVAARDRPFAFAVRPGRA